MKSGVVGMSVNEKAEAIDRLSRERGLKLWPVIDCFHDEC